MNSYSSRTVEKRERKWGETGEKMEAIRALHNRAFKKLCIENVQHFLESINSCVFFLLSDKFRIEIHCSVVSVK